MKVCVYFEPILKRDNFEGARLRKSIKGALEAINIPYTKNIIDSYDVIHFLSSNDEAKINDSVENGIPTVFSALYCEGDEGTRLTIYNENKHVLTFKAKRILDRVDLVFVPSNSAKEFLLQNGVDNNIVVLPVCVNKERFKISDKIIDGLFYSYFQMPRDAKYVVAIGDYTNKNTITILSSIASLCSQYTFFFCGQTKKNSLYNMRKKVPDNLRLNPIMSEEIYRSMMKNASLYLAIDNEKFSPMSLFDAACAKTQIIALEPLLYNREILISLGAIVATNLDDLATKIIEYMDGKIPSNTNKAYAYANRHSLLKLGKDLEKNYLKIIDNKKEKTI